MYLFKNTKTAKKYSYFKSEWAAEEIFTKSKKKTELIWLRSVAENNYQIGVMKNTWVAKKEI